MATLITYTRSKRRVFTNWPNPNHQAFTNWLDLPQDVMIQIFLRVGVIDLLHSAQFVCSSWREFAKDPLLVKDPQLYSVIDMRRSWKRFCGIFGRSERLTLSEKLASQAIRRSRGHLVEFSISYFCTDMILYRLINASFRLKCLRLGTCYHVSKSCLLEVLRNLPLLEEIEFSLFPSMTCAIEVVGSSCPKLKSFRLIRAEVKNKRAQFENTLSNEEAFAIAGNVSPGLRNLQLFGNLMSNHGLEALLKRFSQLEYLDLRRCFNVDLKGDLLRKCLGIRILRLPNDSIEEYEFDAMVYHGR